MLRTVILAALVAGCGGAEGYAEEHPPSPAPVVPLEAGAVVAQIWQFRNDCPMDVSVFVWIVGQDESSDNGGAVQPGHINSTSVKCPVGGEVCYGAWDAQTPQTWGSGLERMPGTDWCAPCSPGWLPARNFRCE